MEMAHKTNLKLLLILIFSLGIFLINQNNIVLAQSPYVLPYPSSMPGSRFYIIQQVFDGLKSYWYFGNFGQFKYNLEESDKYLVEAKILFEYKQHLLAYKSIQKSNDYYRKIYPSLINAQKDHKDISEKMKLFKKASAKHIEIIQKIKQDTPSNYTWTPENEKKSHLKIHDLLINSIKIRRTNL